MNKSLTCPKFEKATNILSQRWTALIICYLFSGPQRFSSIQSSIGISGRLLSERLKDLQSLGIIKREVFAETPVRIEYSLTEKGLSFESLLKEIKNWSQNWMNTENTPI